MLREVVSPESHGVELTPAFPLSGTVAGIREVDGKVKTTNDWEVVGFDGDDGEYYERAQRRGKTRWFILEGG
jgi:hypothetical protein